ncbi:hypothetical protein ISCGN_019575 [Ixodes scapularis]
MATQVGGMMRRIRNKRHGIKEKEAVQLVQAFIVSRLTYGTPYLKLNKTEMNKLNDILRKAYNNALGLPECAATEKRLTLGVHNYSMDELHEAQIISHLKRLDATTNEEWLLHRLGVAVPGGTQVPEGEEEIDHDTRRKFRISKLPKNMHPERDEGRRRARTVALAHSWYNREGSLYVYAAGPSLGVAAIAVASAQGKILRVASIREDSVEQAEEAAIALAVSCNPRATVITDSQKACRNFAQGVLGRPALRILKKVQVQSMGVHLMWAPGPMGHTENEAANAAARAALYRDSSPCPVKPAPDMPYNKYLATLRQVPSLPVIPHPLTCCGHSIHHTLSWLDLYGYPLVSLHPVMYTPLNPCYVRAPHYQYPRSPWYLRALVLRLIFCHLTARRLLLEGAIELRVPQLSSVVEPASQQAGLPTTSDPSLQTGGSSR